jgi:hypothetical protein
LKLSAMLIVQPAFRIPAYFSESHQIFIRLRSRQDICR